MSESDIERRRHEAWQGTLLPFMKWMVILLAAFFFVATVVQLYDLQRRINNSPTLKLKPLLDTLRAQAVNGDPSERVQLLRWQTLTMLEGNAISHRYHQANVLLMSRVWTHYLGFVTGMILALVGAAFILGKLRESGSEISAGTDSWKVSVITASPGLALAVLGTALMVTTLVVRHQITVNDGPLYTYSPAAMRPAARAGSQPEPWPDAGESRQGDTATPASGDKEDAELEEMKRRAEELKGRTEGAPGGG